ncbi:hypothetical protein LC087_15725 [Bacillus carboniphilus]|uniref:Spore coat protein n=1 Tax=Bacillus carboniphilus TaxID=86663 RepID=A0ABY9JRY8_9BACI|nr:hypothetical protein [Bacillus carboniphilus]WLR42171.1 hypothetical protein LC087_15725 [Bacillus carboniphilus]
MTKRKVYEIYIDKNGEKINPEDMNLLDFYPSEGPTGPTGSGDCENTVTFCCIATVPDGFSLSEDFDETLTSICWDFSDVNCCLETTVLDTIPNPCGDGTEISCSIEVQAVKLVGCARMVASAGPLTADTGLGNQCTVSCSTTTCVNQTLNYTCDSEPPCRPCFQVTSSINEFFLSEDECGRQILVVESCAFLEFIGCDECDCF